MVGLPPNSVIPTAGGVLCRRNRGPRRANLLVGVVSGGPPAFRFCLFLPLSVLAVVCSPPGAPSIAPLSHAMGGSNTARTTTFVFAWKGPTARSIAAWGAAPGSGPPQACGLKAHAIAAASRTRLKIFPRFPQQIRVSSPSTPQNPPKPHQPNHIIHLKSWHSSYAPLATINIWIKSIEGQLLSRGNKLPPPARTALSQPNKPHRINLLPATSTRVVILAQPQESSFWRSPRSRHSGAAPASCHSGAAPCVVILSAAKNPRIGLCLFVILSEAQNLCRCLCSSAIPSGNHP